MTNIQRGYAATAVVSHIYIHCTKYDVRQQRGCNWHFLQRGALIEVSSYTMSWQEIIACFLPQRKSRGHGEHSGTVTEQSKIVIDRHRPGPCGRGLG